MNQKSKSMQAYEEALNKLWKSQQVDITISKNQALQILYLVNSI